MQEKGGSVTVVKISTVTITIKAQLVIYISQ